jgi:hypothetical protein
MPSKTVDAVIKAVSDLHDSVIEMRTDMKWLKRGMIGIYSAVGIACLGALVEALIH